MSKRYYIITANSSEPEISYSKNDENTLIFSKVRCRWDYAEKVSGCVDCREQKYINDRLVFKIIESDYQRGKPSKLFGILLVVGLIGVNLIVLLSMTGKALFNLSGPLYQMGGNISTISGLILAGCNIPCIKQRLSRFLSFGAINNKLYLILVSILFSILLSSFLWYFKILQLTDSVLGLVAFVASWVLF